MLLEQEPAAGASRLEPLPLGAQPRRKQPVNRRAGVSWLLREECEVGNAGSSPGRQAAMIVDLHDARVAGSSRTDDHPENLLTRDERHPYVPERPLKSRLLNALDQVAP
jgi:hypothetical protein